MRLSTSSLLTLLISIAVLPNTLLATPVYRWQSSDGVVHYSSKPRAKNDQPANLPPLMRGNVPLSKVTLLSCENHGGINCQAGADEDGSVICYDGYKDASPRFRFSCNSPKLDIADISTPSADGRFKVVVRNSRSVPAAKPELSLRISRGQQVKLIGPDQIEPFGSAEFELDPHQTKLPKEELALMQKPTTSQLNLTCANCP